MPQHWEQTRGEATFEVRLQPDDQELEFAASEAEGIRTQLRGESETIWLEEFPGSDRWKRWVRNHVGEDALAEVRAAVDAELEELAAIRDEIFAKAVEQLRSGEVGDPGRRIDRIRSLAVHYDDLADHAVVDLTDALGSETETMRRPAAAALRRIAEEHPDAVADSRDALVRALGDHQPNVRLDAARALVLLGAAEGAEPDDELLDEVVETLVGLLHEHTRWFSQGPVAGLLGELGREHPDAIETAVEPLIRFVVGDLSSGSRTSGIGRSTAVQALVEIADSDAGHLVEHIDVFIEQLGADRPGVRGRCADVLGTLATRRSEWANRAVPALEGLLDDKDFVRQSAVESLRRIREAFPEIVREGLEDEHLEVLDDSPDVPA